MSNYFKHKMRGKSPGVIAAMIIFGGAAIVGLAILFGFIIMWLWNGLLPELFGLPVITYWQGVGLFILAKILFGGMGCGGSSSSSKSCEDGKKKKKDNDFSKWEHYDKFWQEEGNDAYEKYLERVNGTNENSENKENDEPSDS